MSTSNSNKLCKYCHQPLEKFDCRTLKTTSEGVFGILKYIISFLSILSTPAFVFQNLREKARDKDLEKKGTVTTCVNPDCMGFHEECESHRNYPYSM